MKTRFASCFIKTSFSTVLTVLESLVGTPAWPSARGLYWLGIARGGSVLTMVVSGLLAFITVTGMTLLLSVSLLAA